MDGSIKPQEITARVTRAQKLGIYLFVAGMLEAGALFWHGMPFPTPFPPRGGLIVLVLNRLLPTPLGGLYFLADICSVCFPFVFGVLFVLGRRPLKTYVISEVILSAPTLLVGIDLVRFGGGHLFARDDGFTMLLMFTFLSAVPVLLATGVFMENRSAETDQR